MTEAPTKTGFCRNCPEGLGRAQICVRGFLSRHAGRARRLRRPSGSCIRWPKHSVSSGGGTDRGDGFNTSLCPTAPRASCGRPRGGSCQAPSGQIHGRHQEEAAEGRGPEIRPASLSGQNCPAWPRAVGVRRWQDHPKVHRGAQSNWKLDPGVGVGGKGPALFSTASHCAF